MSFSKLNKIKVTCVLCTLKKDCSFLRKKNQKRWGVPIRPKPLTGRGGMLQRLIAGLCGLPLHPPDLGWVDKWVLDILSLTRFRWCLGYLFMFTV
jgi:hypothetical protein